MSERKRFVSPVVTIVLFVLAAALLLGSGIGGARAALTYYSDSYRTQVSMNSTGVVLNENGAAIDGVLLEQDLEEDGSIILGKSYPEELTVTNTGDIDTYVRVSVYKYWLDANGDKLTQLSPDLIGLNLTGGDWVVDEAASTTERTVLYYTKPVSSGETTPAFSDTLTIDSSVAATVSQETSEQDGYTTITTTYAYDGVSFQVEVEADVVQSHNAADAILSAWGRVVTIADDGTLALQ
jgi:hypothetical protein